MRIQKLPQQKGVPQNKLLATRSEKYIPTES